ncbi:3-hydroxyacyl-CoA dehydrogenase NAD-binding domain-containing protein [Moraxella osloensis]|uniref:3-hydroxyacyl-CoA dehydrogenase NAD-binding domain-containing protein n=1 Tax=Moraxella sp. CTOTU49803 TaxID=2953840 RepID=UPI0024C40495|nr:MULTISPECIES: 3-hydroxyacyl-CoA dehydrogenase NAD-binding domain-containing protein [Moraxella]MDK1670345.1 3-hydroxyacyl-CoA dehydrogenase NAD-binding domain-containing protein [Moraxella osloensis]
MTSLTSQAANQLANFSATDDDNIVILTIQQSRKMNVLDEHFSNDLEKIAQSFIEDKDSKGLIITSDKDSFIVGADIDQFANIQSPKQAFDFVEHFKKVLRSLETCGKPVVAALTGTALGGGLEVALGCHYRIAVDQPNAKYGLPEVKLGLLPGGGGTQRLMRLVGMQKALELMTQGTKLTTQAAHQLGIIDAVVTDKTALIEQAKQWIHEHPTAQQPWDAKGFKIPQGNALTPQNAQMLSIAPAMANQKSHGNYPAITHILSCVFEGSLVDIDTALALESRYFVACAMSQVSKNMIGTLWHQLNSINKGQSRPKSIPPYQTKKVGVLGAGMMGAGIAYVSAKAGIDVVLLDTTIENADKGKTYSENLLNKAIAKGRSNDSKKQSLLDKIQTTTDYADLADCDLVIEAVFEDRDIKAKCTQQTEAVTASDAIFASNTSTLPITGLAKASGRPKQFIGLHFFSPVDKMPLVEIIMGEQTDETTLAKAFDYVLQIGKTPIVVNDSRGFYTSRVFATYITEGSAMLSEGVHPRLIEVAGIKSGMPVGPLALQDEVSLGLMLHINEQTKKDLQKEGKEMPHHPADSVVELMGKTHGRLGKKVGKGFYDYPEGGEKQLWSGLSNLFPVADTQPTQQELIDRFMFIQANETARCYEENVINSIADANIGSIFGWGFAPHHGGTLQFINAYGVDNFVARSQQLAERYGERFAPAQVLVAMAKAHKEFVNE